MVAGAVEVVVHPSPVVVSVPHGGTHVPAALTADLLVPAADLWSDWYSYELFAPLAQVGASLLATRWSRFVADVNRGPETLPSGPFWRSRVATTTPDGTQLYATTPSPADVERRLDLAWRPYHQALRMLIERAVARHGRALVLDLHTFGIDLPADIVLGDRDGTTASPATLSRLEGLLHQQGFRTARSLRFRGGWVVGQFAGASRVQAVQLELNQRLYLEAGDVDRAQPRPRVQEAGLIRVRTAVERVVRTLAEEGAS